MDDDDDCHKLFSKALNVASKIIPLQETLSQKTCKE